jgi:transposase
VTARTAQTPLTPEQRRAAELLGGRGWQQKAVARELNISEKSVQRWRKRSDFAALIEQRRAASLAASPTVQSVLASALSATRRDGSPDWSTRLKACQLLLTDGRDHKEGAQEVRETRIYVSPSGE